MVFQATEMSLWEFTSRVKNLREAMDTMDTTEADGLTIDEGIIWKHLMRLTGQVRFSGDPSSEFTHEKP